MESSESKYIETVIASWPVEGPEAEDRTQNSIIEHERLRIYNEIKKWLDELSTPVSDQLYKLWMYTSYLCADPNVNEPVFFNPSKKIRWPDNILNLTEDQLKDLNARVREGNEIIDAMVQNPPKMGKLTQKVHDSDSETSNVILTRNVKGSNRQVSVPKDLFDKLSTIADSTDEIERLILRYQIGLIPERQPNAYYATLESTLKINHHVFSTPFDSFYINYGSEYLDTDGFSGSLGSVFRDKQHVDFLIAGGNFEVNCIHLSHFHSLVVNYLIKNVLSATKKPILFVVLYDATIDTNDYAKNPFQVWNIAIPPNQVSGSKYRLAIFKNDSAKMPSEVALGQIAVSVGVTLEKKHIIPEILFPFEKATVLGRRAEMLAKGAPMVLKDVPKTMIDLITIAEMELERGVLPGIKIMRKMPSGEVEEVDPNKLFDPTRGAYRYPSA